MQVMLKTKLLAFGAALVAMLLTVIKFLTVRNKQLKHKAKVTEKALTLERDKVKNDNEIDQDYSHRAAEARKDIRNKRIPAHLRNPRN